MKNGIKDMKNTETTARLTDALSGIKSEKEVSAFLQRYSNNGYEHFYQFFNDYVSMHELDVATIHKLSRISKDYVYQITNGKRLNPGRDKILALCIASGMTYSETNRALEISGAGILYAKNERDVRIAICINNHIRDVMEVNLYLEEHGVDILSV